MVTDSHTDLEVQDRDAEQKAKSKVYADARRGAQYSTVNVGDEVLLHQDKVVSSSQLTSTPRRSRWLAKRGTVWWLSLRRG